jgi:hypothetical protein
MRESVLRPAGVLITTPDDGGPEQQVDTVQCCHCGRHWIYAQAVIKAIEGGLGYCAKCNGITCGKRCQKCVPQELLMENLEHYRPEDYQTTVVGFTGVDWKLDG